MTERTRSAKFFHAPAGLRDPAKGGAGERKLARSSAVSAVCRPCARASSRRSAARSRRAGHSTASARPCVAATSARRGPDRRPQPPVPRSAWHFGPPQFSRLLSPCKPCALQRCTRSRRVCRSMPAACAAPVRFRPSSASASIRRAAAASLVRPAAARKPRASRSARVIAIVMSNPPAQEAVIQTRHILATHVRVNKTGGWYEAAGPPK